MESFDEANSSLRVQEIQRCVENPHFHHRIQNIRVLEYIPSQINLLQNFIQYFFKVNFYNILSSKSVCPKCYLENSMYNFEFFLLC